MGFIDVCVKTKIFTIVFIVFGYEFGFVRCRVSVYKIIFCVLTITNKPLMNYKGVIIEESLENPDVLKKVKILNTRIELVNKRHKTPWIKRWTMYTVEIPESEADNFAEEVSKALDSRHKGNWYADFKNNKIHYVIFRDKVFSVDRSKKEQYGDVVKYGVSVGISDYQLDFYPAIEEWER